MTDAIIKSIITRIENQISESMKDSPANYGEQCHRRALREALIIIRQEAKINSTDDIEESAWQAINHVLAQRNYVGRERIFLADCIHDSIRPFLKEQNHEAR